jgi:hypothetical protein
VLFNSYVFIFCFLPLVLAGYALLRRASNVLWPIGWLVLASLVYYAWCDRSSCSFFYSRSQ